MTDEPIEEYLDRLLDQAELPTRQKRRLLAEAEAHLYDSAAALEAGGRASSDAQTEAVRRFGADPTHLVQEMQRARRPSVRDVLIVVTHALALAGGFGLVAVGLSGALAWIINALAGPHFVGALPETYDASVCQHFLGMHPGADSCQTAAAWETSQDAVSLRLLAGGLGLLVLLVAIVWRRRRLSQPTIRTIDTVSAGLAAVAFGAAAVFLGGMSADLAVQHGSGGVGWYLTGALAAAAAFVPCAARVFWCVRPFLGMRLVGPSHPLRG